MTIVFVLLLVISMVGLCSLVGKVVRSAANAEMEAGIWSDELPRVRVTIPDTVPSEWIDAYRNES